LTGFSPYQEDRRWGGRRPVAAPRGNPPGA